MALNDFFVWGSGGKQLTPEEIEQRRQVEAALVARGGIDTSPVASPFEGIGRVVSAAAGAYRRNRLDGAAKDNATYNSGLISALMGGGGSSPSAGSSPIPMTGAKAEVSGPNPYSGAPIDTSTDVASYIKDAAVARGIDPQTALRVAKSEGGFGNPVQQSYSIRKDGSRETSYGPFQLLIGGGLGDQALKAGIDPRDPNQWQKGVDFALDQVRKGGWGPWYGAQKQGITGMMGVGDMPVQQPAQVASLDPAAGMPMPTAAGQMQSTGPAPQADAPPLPPPTTVSATPPVASVPAVAPAPVPGVQVAQDSGVSGQALANAMKVLSDPRANENTKAIAKVLVQQQQARQQAILEQQLKQSDSGYQADLRLKNLQADQIANPRISPTDQANIDLSRDKFTFEKDQGALTGNIKEYNAYAADERAAGRQPIGRLEYEQSLRKASAANTTINNGESNKFYNTIDEANAKIFSGLSDAGIQGRSKLGQIDQLEGLLNSAGTGAMAVLKQRAGDLGINTDGLDDIQAASALLSRMIPEQRAPGSGPVSDADLAGFRNSLPRLINQPGGNEIILRNMRGLAQYQIAQGVIADKVANREITPAEGREQIANLPNPLAGFKPPAADTSSKPQQGGARPRAVNPQTGAIIEFDGKNWVNVQ